MTYRVRRAALFLTLTCGLAACSLPNLDPPECAASRTVLREFYSYHFGNDMKFSQDGLKSRERFITPSLSQSVVNTAEGSDPFTTGDSDIPKAFRVAECRVLSPDRAEYAVLLFWKDDRRSEERRIAVQVAKIDGNWLVDKIVR